MFELVFLFLGDILLALSACGPWCMHASTVLGKQVFAVEVVEPFVDVGAGAHVTTVVSELQVLGGNMPFPFVLVGERGAASIVVEGAGEVL